MNRLKTVAEAAGVLNVSESWLSKQVAARLILHTRFGRSIRFTDEQLAAIVAARAEAPIVVPIRRGLRGVA